MLQEWFCHTSPLDKLLATSLLLGFTASAAQADDAPKSVKTEGFAYTVAVHTVQGNSQDLMEHRYVMRWAQPRSAPEEQLTADDPFLSELLQDPEQPFRFLHFKLTIDIAGEVARCIPVGRDAPGPELVAKACEMLSERVEFVPTLHESGRPLQTSVAFKLRAESFHSYPTAAIQEGYETSAPRPLRNVRFSSPQDWPPFRHGEIFRNDPFSVSGIDQGLVDEPLARPSRVAGVYIFRNGRTEEGDPQIFCKTGIPSRSVTFDIEACELALQAIRPSAEKLSNRHEYPLLVAGKGKAERVIGPVKELAKEPVLRAGIDNDFLSGLISEFVPLEADAERLRLGLKVDREGRVKDCRIFVTSGNTDADLLACKMAREQLIFEPATDYFGRKMNYTIRYWQL